jgi:hypothetical protein
MFSTIFLWFSYGFHHVPMGFAMVFTVNSPCFPPFFMVKIRPADLLHAQAALRIPTYQLPEDVLVDGIS